MLKRVRLVLILLVLAVAGGVLIAFTSGSNLFATADWLIIRAIVIGLILGAARSVMRKDPEIQDGMVTRHDAGSFLSHWGTATGIFLLIISGFLIGFYPSAETVISPERKMLATNLHFVGLVLTLICGFFWAADFIVTQKYSTLIPNLKDIIFGTIGKYLLRRKWHNEYKYLSSQKSAFLAFACLGGVILITGAIKVGAYTWVIPGNVLSITTIIHDTASLLFILLLIVHVVIVVILKHWPSFKSWFTGKIPLEYVKHEYPLWYEEIKEKSKKAKTD